MNELLVKCKLLHHHARLPSKKNFFDAAWDLYSMEDVIIRPGEAEKIRTGIALEIPNGYVGLIWPRSSMGANGLTILGGVIDATYRGEVLVMVGNFSYSYTETKNIRCYESDGIVSNKSSYEVKHGDKIAQILIQECNPFVTFEAADRLSDTNRGNKGFGSSGK